MAQYNKRLALKKELRTVYDISYTPQHIARLEVAGRFPKRVQLGPNRGAWILSEVDAWVNERIANRNAPRCH